MTAISLLPLLTAGAADDLVAIVDVSEPLESNRTKRITVSNLYSGTKAGDSEKLDGVDSTGYVNILSAQTISGVKTFTAIPVLPASNPTTSNQAVRKGYADATYLGIGNKAADSDKLDNLNSTDFLQKTEAVWTSYSPTVTAQTGTLTTVTATGSYSQIGKIVNVKVKVVITNKGTGAGNIIITLPVTSAAQFLDSGSGYSYITASATLSDALIVTIAPTSSIRACIYSGATAIVDGRTLIISMTYESA